MKAVAATAEASSESDDNKDPSKSNVEKSTSKATVTILSSLRTLCLDFPFLCLVGLLGMTLVLEHVYLGPIQVLVESYRRSGMADYWGYYTDFYPDLTYYGRQCDKRDVSTKDSNDLIIPTTSEATPQLAQDIMMTHGAVLIPNLLSNTTATALRDYLETRHDIKDRLPWHEKFWGDIGRLSLGLGAEDHPIIEQALQEVTNNPTLQTTLEGIVGPDPSIVEISTLTTLHGAKDQGIHTDSDYFGSSLLYSRTFLHSYTLFMALQDTTSKMGATTVCPGTQWCANEDLSDVCHENGAFEVSSNGQTGREVGLLYQGDGMMFNQNIWHRGPRNLDHEFPINRVMFILTFVSRHDLEKGDVRQQGLGTYYYQRWNMWGHTLSDLQQAATRMRQPVLRSLKALGLWKPPNTKWGIPWLEHFARQLANDEDFFANYELEDFQAYLAKIGIYDWLPDLEPFHMRKSSKQTKQRRTQEQQEEDEEWEPFLKKCLKVFKNSVEKFYWQSLVAYITLQLVLDAVGRVVRRLVTIHVTVGLLSYAILKYVTEYSYLGHRITMRDSWRQPFPTPKSFDHLTATTYPNRNDVLIGSRFDAPYLSSFNHVLDYHPGNKRLQTALTTLPSLTLVEAYWQQPKDGVVARMLEQDYQTGFWSLMDTSATRHTLEKMMFLVQNPTIEAVDTHLKIAMADARFGLERETAMARHKIKWIESMQSKILSGVPYSDSTSTKDIARRPASPIVPSHTRMLHLKDSPTVPDTTRTASSILLWNNDGDEKTLQLRVGDHVLGHYFDTEEYWEAEIQRINGVGDDTRVRLLYTTPGDYGASGTVDPDMVRPFQSIVQGEYLDVISDEGEWIPAKIVLVHPLGQVTVEYDDGSQEAGIPLSALRPYEEDAIFPISLVGSTVEDASPPHFQIGQRVYGNFEGRGRLFPGTIDHYNGDGTFAIAYDDGDYEQVIDLQNIQAMY